MGNFEEHFIQRTKRHITVPSKLAMSGFWEALRNLIFGYLLPVSVSVFWSGFFLKFHCRIPIFCSSFCFLPSSLRPSEEFSIQIYPVYLVQFYGNVVSYFYLWKLSCDLISSRQAWQLRDSAVSVPRSAGSVSWGQSVPGTVVVLIIA